MCLVFVCLGYVIVPKREIDREREGEREKECENFTKFKIAILISMGYVLN